MDSAALTDFFFTALAVVAGVALFIGRRRGMAPSLAQRKAAAAADPAQESAKESEASRMTLFTPGRRYRVRRGFHAHPLAFETSEVLTFETAAYSRYDNCHVYGFTSETGMKKDYWLSDEDPAESWERYFEPL